MNFDQAILALVVSYPISMVAVRLCRSIFL